MRRACRDDSGGVRALWIPGVVNTIGVVGSAVCYFALEEDTKNNAGVAMQVVYYRKSALHAPCLCV